MKTKIQWFFIVLALPLIGLSQDFRQQFRDALTADDSLKQESVLKQWMKKSPNDPELYVSRFNYHVNRSRTETLSITTDQRSEEALELQDSTGATAGFMGSIVSYNPDEVKKALDVIEQGIAKHPKRLDMRFGKLFLLKEDQQYEKMTDELINTIDYAKTKHDWLWKDGKPAPDGERFFLGNVQAYIGYIYETGNDDLLPLMRRISEAVVKYYPDNVESLSNIAITHLLKNEYDLAIPYLLRAEKADPTDTIVLNNLAETYKRSGKNAEAKSYYQKMIKHGNDEDKAYAKEMIDKLD